MATQTPKSPKVALEKYSFVMTYLQFLWEKEEWNRASSFIDGMTAMCEDADTLVELCCLSRLAYRHGVDATIEKYNIT